MRLELFVWPLAAGAYYWLDPHWVRLGAFAGAYLASSLLLSPDLDLRENRSRRRWGGLGFLWVPYTKLFKHRGLSHHLLWGPLTRLGYLTVIAGALLAGLYYVGVALPPIRWRMDSALLLPLAAGLYLPNVLHALYDRWDSRFKMRTRSRARRPGRAHSRSR